MEVIKSVLIKELIKKKQQQKTFLYKICILQNCFAFNLFQSYALFLSQILTKH